MNATLPGAGLVAHPDKFFIDGAWVVPSSGSTFEVITPSTEDVFLRVAEAQAPDVERAVAAARRAFDHGPWTRMSHAERAGYLRAIAERVRTRATEFAEIWTREVGVVSAVAHPMSLRVAETYDYYASLADTFAFEEKVIPKGPGNVGFVTREPVGVVAAIVPWNGPLFLMSWKVAPALLAGCTVILKASPEAPAAALIMAEIMQAVGLPNGVFNVLTADRGVSELLISHPGVDKVTFTGSSATGKRIAAICGARMARYTMELGGKSAALVLDDYDLETVAQSLSGSARMMTGQVCASLTRVVVARHRHDDLVEAMAEAFRTIRVGDPFSADTDMGPLAMARQRERVEGYFAKGRAEGATVATGGGRPSHLSRGYFVEATVFGNVHNSMAIAQEEIFGPVVSVIPADNEQHAVEIANDSIYGLNASVFTNDADHAYRVARQLRSGTVGHNAYRVDFSLAFGGFKQSGVGREGGVEGLLPFLETKSIILDNWPRHAAD
ncbi:MAG TPA: aldehyde dehydrogenase [Caulobacteraceae bacterium]|nr:aldehyde dehydrogenase [Caulobacteraceae bacterium]